MRHFHSLVAAAALCSAALLAPSPARSNPIYVSQMELTNGWEVVRLAGGVFGSGREEIAGQQHLTANPGSSNKPLQHYDIYAWCVDVFHYIYLGANAIVYDAGALATNGNGIRLTDKQAAQIAWLADYGDRRLASGGPNSALSAAVQAAIWNLEYGSTYVGSNDAIRTELDALSRLLPDRPPALDAVALLSRSDAHGVVAQGLLTVRQAPPGVPVPEPGAVALFALGLGALGLIRRRADPPAA